ncbi:MAG: hypothetical protein RLZZ86_4143 [Cyanobacteriota bacterium]
MLLRGDHLEELPEAECTFIMTDISFERGCD